MGSFVLAGLHYGDAKVRGEFANTKETLQKISTDLLARNEHVTAELFLQGKGPSTGEGRPREYKGPLVQMLALLEKYCVQFPRGIVRYEPDHPYGLVMTIICHCHDVDHGACATKCPNFDERPRALLTLRHIGTEDVLIGEKEIPEVHSWDEPFRP